MVNQTYLDQLQQLSELGHKTLLVDNDLKGITAKFMKLNLFQKKNFFL